MITRALTAANERVFLETYARTKNLSDALWEFALALERRQAKRAPAPDVEVVLETVCELFAVPRDRLTDGDFRVRAISDARAVAAVILRSGKLSRSQIARALGLRDHTSILAACRRGASRPDLAEATRKAIEIVARKMAEAQREAA